MYLLLINSYFGLIDYYVGLINSYVGHTKACVELTYLIYRTETVQIVTMTLAGQFEEDTYWWAQQNMYRHNDGKVLVLV